MKDLTEHGPQAFYAGGPGEPYYQPSILCLCNWSTGREQTWEECGRLFDEHLSEVL
jgi:hypothetical protein